MLLSILVFGFLASSQVQEDARQQIRNGLLSQAAILKLIFTPYLRDAKTIDLQEIAALVEAQEARQQTTNHESGERERIYYWSHKTHNVKRVLKFTMGPKTEERQRHFHQCRDW